MIESKNRKQTSPGLSDDDPAKRDIINMFVQKQAPPKTQNNFPEPFLELNSQDTVKLKSIETEFTRLCSSSWPPSCPDAKKFIDDLLKTRPNHDMGRKTSRFSS